MVLIELVGKTKYYKRSISYKFVLLLKAMQNYNLNFFILFYKIQVKTYSL